MRVLHINCNYVGTTLHQLMIEQLDALGYSNQVFVPIYDKKLAVITINKNVCLSECFHKCDRLFFDYKQKKIRVAIEKEYDFADVDLIHAYTLFTDGNCARKLSKKYGIPYVVAIRNTDVNTFLRWMPFLRNRGLRIMLDASAVFFLSDAYRKQVFDNYIPQKLKAELEAKTYIIPNGIDRFWFENIPGIDKLIDKKSIKLVYAGRIDKNKNITTIQKAMSILRTQGYNISLSVVGKIFDKNEFRIIENDHFTKYYPAMPKEKLIDVYRASDIFVMPSYTESFGLVYAEAMSQGLPVIYSKGQGFDNQFPEGVVGYHVIADSPDDVAEGIKRVVDNYFYIQKNVVSLATEFSWPKLVEKYDHIYRTVLSR